MKKMQWICLMLCICLLMAAGLPSAMADGGNAVTAGLKMRIATRTGPSTQYTEPGTFFEKDWYTAHVDVISKAYGSGVWWVQVEFTDGGKLYRAYTGVKRVNVQLDRIPEEEILGTAVLSAAGDVTAYYGPGDRYAKMKDVVPWGTQGKIVMAENGYVLMDFYDEYINQQRRAWIFSDLVDVDWYAGMPESSIPGNLANIAPGTAFWRSDEPSSFCQVLDYQEKGSYSVMNLYLSEVGYFNNVYVYMEGQDHGTFALANGANGEIWFGTQTVAIETYMPQYGIDSVLVFNLR